jgi:hypothetical protein
LNGHGVRELEAAEVGVDPAAVPEGRVEHSVRQIAECAEVPVGSPINELADRHDPTVALDRHVLCDPREIVGAG